MFASPKGPRCTIPVPVRQPHGESPLSIRVPCSVRPLRRLPTLLVKGAETAVERSCGGALSSDASPGTLGVATGRKRRERFNRRVDQTECSFRRTTPSLCIQAEFQVFIEITDTMDQLRVFGTRPDLPEVPTIGVRPDLGNA